MRTPASLLFFAVVVFNYACYQRIGPGHGAHWLALALVVDLANLFFFETSFFLSIIGGFGFAVGERRLTRSAPDLGEHFSGADTDRGGNR